LSIVPFRSAKVRPFAERKATQPLSSLPKDFDAQEPGQGLSDDGAAAPEGMLRRVVVDGLQDTGFLRGENRANGDALSVPSRGIPRPLFQLRHFSRDFRSDRFMPLFFFGMMRLRISWGTVGLL
jgi:hypothetical protein